MMRAAGMQGIKALEDLEQCYHREIIECLGGLPTEEGK
jgi:hypothetical protein